MTTMEPTGGHILHAAQGERAAPMGEAGSIGAEREAPARDRAAQASGMGRAAPKGSPDPTQGTDRYRLVTPFTLRL